jgi:hypothetical protein
MPQGFTPGKGKPRPGLTDPIEDQPYPLKMGGGDQSGQGRRKMRIPRLRIRSLMILVLASALILGAILQIPRMTAHEFDDFKQRAYIVGVFLILVFSKLCLAIGMRTRRAIREEHERAWQADSTPEELTSS